jgi:hypothetical protein
MTAFGVGEFRPNRRRKTFADFFRLLLARPGEARHGSALSQKQEARP